ncbi:hypothetical protein LPAF129_15860 [Ligilactobacillus pabuli]|uniref:Uncharacterized protein n=1 Tax=Ligilactobacillus pabuli TaxID=2886039 RepID=A0ABQ5JME5_9LACO|nr:hypothetical protein [Ligilactobacillus pabuli]GKS81900.1 hypothetical protein LPAF129_15860 [Ligilactobacillus pabuli]HIW89073.1 hypothetical protein [Candidatus Ligilactobacillus excrementipullorum]
MDKVVDQFNIGKYTILYLKKNASLVRTRYTKYKIRGVEYDPVPVTDVQDAIAINRNDEDLIGEFVEYV